MHNLKIAYIGISYKSIVQAKEWIASILKCNYCRESLILIVDTSGAESIDYCNDIESIDPCVRYLNPKNNLGYIGGGRYGKRYLDEQGFEFEYLVVSNVDLRFVSWSIPDEIMKYSIENVGVISPSIVDNGSDLNPYKINRTSKEQMQNRLLYYKYYRLQGLVDMLRIIRKNILKQKSKNEVYAPGTKIYMTHGACFIFHTSLFCSWWEFGLPNVFIRRRDLCF